MEVLCSRRIGRLAHLVKARVRVRVRVKVRVRVGVNVRVRAPSPSPYPSPLPQTLTSMAPLVASTKVPGHWPPIG